MLNKIAVNLIVIWLMMSLVFLAIRILPGDIVTVKFAGSGVSESSQTIAREQLGLTLPWIEQYTAYLSAWLRGDWGYALSTGEPVWNSVMRSIGITLPIATTAMVIAVLVGIIWASMMVYVRLWYLRRLLIILLDLVIAVPIYWSLTLLLLIFTFPVVVRDIATVLAMSLLGLHIGANITHLLSHATRQELGTPHIQTAVSKGLSQYQIYLKHVLPNITLVLIPFVVANFSLLIGGTVIVESILLLPGIGTLILNATMNRDYTLLQGALTMIMLWIALINVVGEMILYALNPRLRIES